MEGKTLMEKLGQVVLENALGLVEGEKNVLDMKKALEPETFMTYES